MGIQIIFGLFCRKDPVGKVDDWYCVKYLEVFQGFL